MAELTHEQLWEICHTLPDDYEPWGTASRQEAFESGKFDCSSGCIWYHALEGIRGLDWGVCGNLRSHRHGLLTFEHQGCVQFEPEPAHDEDA